MARAAAQADLAQLPQALLSISRAELAAMQRALAHVWHRFLYSSLPIFRGIMQDAYDAAHAAVPDAGHTSHAGGSTVPGGSEAPQHASGSSLSGIKNIGRVPRGRDGASELLPPAVTRNPAEDDAFMTIMQCLAARLDA